MTLGESVSWRADELNLFDGELVPGSEGIGVLATEGVGLMEEMQCHAELSRVKTHGHCVKTPISKDRRKEEGGIAAWVVSCISVPDSCVP
ncbi:unnamed protein product [Fusarium graminearum]|nr:unnamed protein product [Fusarium graminearum]